MIIRNDSDQNLSGLNQNQTHLDGNGIKNGFDPAKIAKNQETGQIAAEVGMRAAGAGQANQVWSMDFVFDRTAEGRVIKCPTIVDDATHESVAIEVERAISGQGVVRVLERLALSRGLPKVIRTDNGKEFCGKAIYADTQVSAGDNLNLVSGHDLALIGAQATGEHIDTIVGHNLTVISPQATDSYHGSHHAVGGGIMAGAGLVSGGVSLSQGHADNSYHSVDQASGFQAGAGGYDILVGNHTGLIGGQLASTATPDKNTLNTGSLSYQDLDNRSQWSAEQTGLSLGGNPLAGARGSAGASLGLITPQNHDSQSTTHSGVAAGTVIVSNGPPQDLRSRLQ